MSNKIIIFSTLLFVFISFTYLAARENSQANLNSKNIWMIYFNNPKDNSLDFTIENHSSNATFHWQVLANTHVVKEGDENVSLGAVKNVSIQFPDQTESEEKVTVSVSTGNEKKEIYKIF